MRKTMLPAWIIGRLLHLSSQSICAANPAGKLLRLRGGCICAAMHLPVSGMLCLTFCKRLQHRVPVHESRRRVQKNCQPQDSQIDEDALRPL